MGYTKILGMVDFRNLGMMFSIETEGKKILEVISGY